MKSRLPRKKKKRIKKRLDVLYGCNVLIDYESINKKDGVLSLDVVLPLQINLNTFKNFLRYYELK